MSSLAPTFLFAKLSQSSAVIVIAHLINPSGKILFKLWNNSSKRFVPFQILQLRYSTNIIIPLAASKKTHPSGECFVYHTKFGFL